jgi:tRNA(Ile)-lysidine synthase
VLPILERLRDTWLGLPHAKLYYLAFSGGLDSTVLLHLLSQLPDLVLGRLQAVHVHHGLHAAADAWSAHCARVCADLGIPLRQLELQLKPQPGESVEAVARARRYGALVSLMGEGDVLLTAQHQDDQAETLMLQLLRGSGPAGLAAMPRLYPFGPGWLARPLLDVSRNELAEYAGLNHLSWVEDPSNRDLRFDRNFLRYRVMPLLRQRWPSAAVTIARSARLSAELQDLADELAVEDLQQAQGRWPGTLSIPALGLLSSARRRSLLRHWVRRQGGVMPGSRHLQRIERECLESRSDAQPLVQWSDLEVRRFRDGLFLLKPQPHDPTRIIPWLDNRPLQLPDGMGKLLLEPAEQGISAAEWQTAGVEIRFRQGGERCVPAGQVHHRVLKKLYQEWSIPPWLRDRIPLVYLDGQLAAVPGHLLCEPFKAAPDEPALNIHWIPPVS